jgi:hypothetical protein
MWVACRLTRPSDCADRILIVDRIHIWEFSRSVWQFTCSWAGRFDTITTWANRRWAWLYSLRKYSNSNCLFSPRLLQMPRIRKRKGRRGMYLTPLTTVRTKTRPRQPSTNRPECVHSRHLPKYRCSYRDSGLYIRQLFCSAIRLGLELVHPDDLLRDVDVLWQCHKTCTVSV